MSHHPLQNVIQYKLIITNNKLWSNSNLYKKQYLPKKQILHYRAGKRKIHTKQAE